MRVPLPLLFLLLLLFLLHPSPLGEGRVRVPLPLFSPSAAERRLIVATGRQPVVRLQTIIIFFFFTPLPWERVGLGQKGPGKGFQGQ